MQVDTAILTTFIIYFAIVLSIGIVAGRVTKDLSDYILGGRSLGGPIAAMGVGASDMSGWLLLGLPGAAYVMGINHFWMPLGLALGSFVNWQIVATRLRIYTEVVKDSLTIPAYFDNRFHDHSGVLRVVTAVVILVFFTVYSAAGFVGGAILFQTIFNLPYTTALWISAIVIIVYTSEGGFLAVSWTDFFQGSLMFIALLIVPFAALHHLGGWHKTLNIIHQHSPMHLDALSHITGIGIISLIAWGLGYFGQPHILVRFMAVRSPKVVPEARFICTTWMNIALYGAIFTGLIGYAYFINKPLLDSEAVFLELAKTLFNPWVAGVLLAAVLSAIMSTIAAQLLASSSALVEDFYHRFIRKSAGPRELVWASRAMVVLIALAALWLASNPQGTVLNLVKYAWAGLGAAFGPVILLSLFWPRMTRNGAVLGMILGALTIIIWKHFQYLGGIMQLYEIIPGFVLCTLGVVVGSYIGAKPTTDMQQEYQTVLSKLRDA